METCIWSVDKENPDREVIARAARIIRKGGLVAFPTETVYGLGANGLDGSAVQKIFTAKGRPADNPLILHIAEAEGISPLVTRVPPAARVLMEAFWPGPLTLVLPCRDNIPREVTAGLDTVAVRMPRHPVALALIREAGVPIAAPSANISGYPSPTMAGHVFHDLHGKIEAILDGGPSGVGLESTVLDLTGETPVILRPGDVTLEDLQGIIGRVQIDPGLKDNGVPKAPGMKYTHYSPRADVFLVEGDTGSVSRRMTDLAEDYRQKGRRVGLLLSKETAQALGPVEPAYSRILGSRDDLGEIAHNIYHELRRCDEAGVDVILTETYPEEGLGLALMNRLLKSAGYNIIQS